MYFERLCVAPVLYIHIGLIYNDDILYHKPKVVVQNLNQIMLMHNVLDVIEKLTIENNTSIDYIQIMFIENEEPMNYTNKVEV